MHLSISIFSCLILFLNNFLLNIAYCVEYVIDDLFDVIFLQKGFSLASGSQFQ